MINNTLILILLFLFVIILFLVSFIDNSTISSLDTTSTRISKDTQAPVSLTSKTPRKQGTSIKTLGCSGKN